MLVSEYRRYKVNKAKAWRKNESNNEAPVYTLGEQANCASKEIENEESSTSDADQSSTNILVETTHILKNTQYTDTMSVKNQGDQEDICQDWAEDGDKTLHPSKGPNVKSQKLKRLTRPLLKPFTAFGFSKSDKIRASKTPAEAKERYSHEYDQSTNFGSDSQLVYSNRTDAICEKGDETNSYEYLVEKNLPSQKTHKTTTLFAENPRPISIDMGAIYNIQEKHTKHPRNSIHNIRDYQHT
ncbi:hypothetical protein AX774_g1328 [Zancudomyces culisetae]|uniref:Uncharacterized protein n=1 Tax=Zancudomyces culisetae TaxID=1213189 RepID=A0A1R1PVY5_ZANCU|nr:hypothetical protein AX774_g1328 [Zancudomyces culisetae]|eukprot:OMH85108.1 hypothetical protein AX774_g1328 [Zancudomyces culisetae]